MSGSPKVAQLRIIEAEARRLEESRRRQAEAEARRRQEAERRARAALAQRLRQNLGESAVIARRLLAQLRQSAPPELVVPHLESEIDALLARAGLEPEDLSDAVGAMEGMLRRVRALEQHGLVLSDQFSAEAAEIQAEASQAADRARIALQMRLAGLRGDDVLVRWVKPALDVIEAEIEGLAEGAGQRATALTVTLNAAMDEAIATAQAQQLAEEKRAWIVGALLSGLAAQGFHLSDPVLVSDRPDADVAFRAVRADRRLIDVAVPLTGPVVYEVDGADIVVEAGRDGSDDGQTATCDETEARLDALHADLAARFDIEAGALEWAGKPASRERKSARALPGGAAREQKR